MKKIMTLLTLTIGLTLMSLGGKESTLAKPFSRELFAGGPPPTQPTPQPGEKSTTPPSSQNLTTPQTNSPKPTAKPNPQPTVKPNQNSVIWFNCRTREVWTPEKAAWCEKTEKLKNVSYQLPSAGDKLSSQTIELQNGVYQNKDKRLYFGLLNQPKLITFADVNKDGKTDGLALIAVNTGSPFFLVYLVVISDVMNNPKNLVSTFLGERMNVQSIVVNKDKILVEMVKPEPLSRVTQTYVLDRNQLKLLSDK